MVDKYKQEELSFRDWYINYLKEGYELRKDIYPSKYRGITGICYLEDMEKDNIDYDE